MKTFYQLPAPACVLFLLAACSGGGGSSTPPSPEAVSDSAITETTLAVSSLNIPTSGYTQQNNAELGATVLTSPQRLLQVPPNTVSFALQLAGPDVELNPHEPSFFLNGMEDADGNPLTPFQRHANFCDSGLCATLLPRRPDAAIARGDWPYFMGTFADTLNDIDLQATTLHAAIRTGPAPDPTADFPATITVRPFMTADSITETELDKVLAQFVQIANDNSIAIDLEPITVVAGEEFNEVSKDFNDPTTAELVRMGDAGKVNIFFLESFTGSSGGGLLGISGGLPGPLGVANSFNGVLINATTTYSATAKNFASSEKFMGDFWYR